MRTSDSRVTGATRQAGSSQANADGSLSQIGGWLIDLDGVIYRGDTVTPGATDFVDTLRGEGTPFLFVTNNSSRTPEQYAHRLQTMGIAATPDDFYTSALATAEYLAGRSPDGARILMLGLDGLCHALLQSGNVLVQEPTQADYVVVGFSNRFTYDELARLTTAIRAGVPFIGTNPDPTLPVEGGFAPGNGALLALLATASGVQPTVMGKPARIILDLALKRLGVPTDGCAIVGDRLDTDVVGGQNAGLYTVLVLTGSTTAEEAASSTVRPNLIARDLPELMRRWKVRHVHG